MAMRALRDGAKGGILKFFLLGILCLAGGGLVFTDVGGFFRGGVSSNDVVKIGRESVSINSFDRVLRRTLAQVGITPEQAYNLGYLDQILSSEISRRSLMRAAGESNILVAEDYVIEKIKNIIAPALTSGLSTEQALGNLLRSQGISESELKTTILSERTLSIFGDAMEAGALYTPTKLAKTLYAYDNETRDIRYLAFLHKDFKEIEEPTEEQLLQLYEATKESYASPERRDIVVGAINTQNLEKTITIEESEIKDIYENDISLYTTPASRTVTQAIFKSEEEAQNAFEKLKPSNFNETAKNLKADIIPAKAFGENEILDELKTPVFTSEKTGVLEPVKTPLGWTVVNLSMITQETVKPFDSVKKEIREDIIQDQLIDEIYKLVDEVDEFFITGGSIEDAKEQFDLEIKTFSGITRFGRDEQQKTPLMAIYERDAQNILESVYELDEGATSPAFELNDGKFVVVNNGAITAKTYTPFTEVKDAIKAKWIKDQRQLSNRKMLIELQKEKAFSPIDEIATEKSKSFKTIKAVKRNDEESPLSPSARNAIFNAKKGEHFIIDIKEGIALAEVTNITKPNEPNNKAIEELQTQTQQEMQNELLSLYMQKQLEKHPAKVNTRLLQQVYGAKEQGEGF